jgi:hypothetical protein
VSVQERLQAVAEATVTRYDCGVTLLGVVLDTIVPPDELNRSRALTTVTGDDGIKRSDLKPMIGRCAWRIEGPLRAGEPQGVNYDRLRVESRVPLFDPICQLRPIPSEFSARWSWPVWHRRCTIHALTNQCDGDAARS